MALFLAMLVHYVSTRVCSISCTYVVFSGFIRFSRWFRLSQLHHPRFLKPLACPGRFQPCAGYARALWSHRLSGAAGLTGRSLFLLVSFSHAETGVVGPVRACPGLGPAGPVASRSSHSSPTQPAGGRDPGGRGKPTPRPARPTSHTF